MEFESTGWLVAKERTLIYFVRESISVWLISSLTGLDLAKQENLMLIKHLQNNRMQTSLTGGQLNSDTSLTK